MVSFLRMDSKGALQPPESLSVGNVVRFVQNKPLFKTTGLAPGFSTPRFKESITIAMVTMWFSFQCKASGRKSVIQNMHCDIKKAT